MNSSEKTEGLSRDQGSNIDIDISKALSWMMTALKTTPYGEIGLSFVLHSGRVVRIRKILEETKRIEA